MACMSSVITTTCSTTPSVCSACSTQSVNAALCDSPVSSSSGAVGVGDCWSSTISVSEAIPSSVSSQHGADETSGNARQAALAVAQSRSGKRTSVVGSSSVAKSGTNAKSEQIISRSESVRRSRLREESATRQAGHVRSIPRSSTPTSSSRNCTTSGTEPRPSKGS